MHARASLRARVSQPCVHVQGVGRARVVSSFVSFGAGCCCPHTHPPPSPEPHGPLLLCYAVRSDPGSRSSTTRINTVPLSAAASLEKPVTATASGKEDHLLVKIGELVVLWQRVHVPAPLYVSALFVAVVVCVLKGTCFSVARVAVGCIHGCGHVLMVCTVWLLALSHRVWMLCIRTAPGLCICVCPRVCVFMCMCACFCVCVLCVCMCVHRRDFDVWACVCMCVHVCSCS
jgi:hypothetical protein